MPVLSILQRSAQLLPPHEAAGPSSGAPGPFSPELTFALGLEKVVHTLNPPQQTTGSST